MWQSVAFFTIPLWTAAIAAHAPSHHGNNGNHHTLLSASSSGHGGGDEPMAGPITPAELHSPLASLTTAQPPDAELADRIESIDVTAHEIIILTSKVGPAETAQVAITVVDVETWNELPPINLTGIFLLVTRGRYTINFLAPNRWYGVIFRCEQRQPKLGGVSLMPPGFGGIAPATGDGHVNEERHLVKTHKDDGSSLDTQPLVSVGMKRLSNAGKSLENLVVTIKWEQHPNERPNLDAIANITLFCKQHIKYKQLRLYGREIEKSVEVKLDNHFEIMEFYNETRQIIASITPKNCPRICWNVEIVAETPRGAQFRRAGTHDCETIAAVSAATNLREYLGYEIHGNNLTIRTNYSATERENREADAYVQLVAVSLNEAAHQKDPDNSTVRFKTFSTSSDPTNDFTLDHLEPEKLYAIEYKYGKESPFSYAESRRFVVETPSDASAHVMSEPSEGAIGPLHHQWPIRVIIERVTPVRTSPPVPHNASIPDESHSPQSHEQQIHDQRQQKQQQQQQRSIVPPHQQSLLMENKKRRNIFENVDQPMSKKRDDVNLTPVVPSNVDSHSSKPSKEHRLGEKAHSEQKEVDEEEHHAPKIIMQLEPAFQNYKVGVDLEPFCELSSQTHVAEPVVRDDEEEGSDEEVTSTKNTHSQFWLTRNQPNYELRHLDVVGAVCGKTPAHPLCRLKFTANSTNPQSVARCMSGAKLCYTPSVRVRGKVYAMDRRCVDVAKQIATQMAVDETANAAEAQARRAAADEPVGSRTAGSRAPSLLSLLIAFLSMLVFVVSTNI